MHRLKDIYDQRREEAEGNRETQCELLKEVYNQEMNAMQQRWNVAVNQEISCAKRESREENPSTKIEILQ